MEACVEEGGLRGETVMGRSVEEAEEIDDGKDHWNDPRVSSSWFNTLTSFPRSIFLHIRHLQTLLVAKYLSPRPKAPTHLPPQSHVRVVLPSV